MNSELLRVSDALNFSGSWVGIAMLSRRTCCARAPLALLSGLPLVTRLALSAGPPLITLLAGLPLITLLALLSGLPLITLIALLTGLTLRTLLSRRPLHRSWAGDATTHKHG
jgi:hypothetical protein